jgi:hypothetical protein
MPRRLPDVLIWLAMGLAVAWLAMVGLGLTLPFGLPRNLLIWLAIAAGAISFWISWRALTKKR